MHEQRMLKPAVIGGVLFAILSIIPVISMFNCVCCAWVIAGGVLAAYLYIKDSPAAVTLGRGALLGLLTGVFGTIASALFSVPLFFLMNREGTGPMEQMRQMIAQMPNLPPESRQALDALFSQKNVGVLIFALGLLFSLVVYCLFAMLGGTIGVAIFEKRKPGATPPSGTPHYEPPLGI